jgi:hypothetical protein
MKQSSKLVLVQKLLQYLNDKNFPSGIDLEK